MKNMFFVNKMKNKICASCESQGNLDRIAKSVYIPEWLEKTNYVRNFIHYMNHHQTLKKNTNNILTKIEFRSSLANRKILLWATTSPNDIFHINGAKKAYMNKSECVFPNHQVGKVSKDGSLNVYLNPPQLYSVIEKGKQKVYPRHFHFVFMDTKEKKWSTQVYTHVVTPIVSKDFVQEAIQSGKIIIIDALPADMFQETKLSETTKSLPADTDFSMKTVQHFAKDMPKLKKVLDRTSLTINHVPIIVYCANKKCNAAKKTIDALLEKQFYNIYYYSEGIDGWNK